MRGVKKNVWLEDTTVLGEKQRRLHDRLMTSHYLLHCVAPETTTVWKYLTFIEANMSGQRAGKETDLPNKRT